MQLYVYKPHELHFAYCYRIYLAWRTHRNKPIRVLASLKRAKLNELVGPYNIRVLECASTEFEVRCVVSLQPVESVSTCASKVKGRVSKWLSDELRLEQPMYLLSKGYFACTIGKTRSKQVERYLDSQSAHHGYDLRILPPVYVNQYALNSVDEARLSPKHAVANIRFHLVFCTAGRKGIFGSKQGERVAGEWFRLQGELQIALIKVSFVPDHVHTALKAHPAVSPASIAAALMNSAQELVQKEMIEAAMKYLWSRSAYIGSYGDLASSQIRKYLENWEDT